ncbi:YL1-domain-containing protein [Trematosphaeria pertusa]|uniref:YL1-domain-containing protein n=1 Tax=Trematosphaeria pertusa TaxID=390896 RepID=A0A6A6IE99_9PLEO|nr:YL1-domain-containing protein [Trematosphaeria pertusa]KAF2248222.1 YL1-domain-containing protein [Trematosphaeria pertusa]
MSPDPAERTDVQDGAPPDRDERLSPSPSAAESEAEAPADLMVVSRARRSNAGNRMSTLIAKSAEEDEWGEEWEEAPNEEEFVGDDANDQDDYNLDSSSSEEDDEGADDDAGEKELRRAERQERIKKRKPATNPFAARLAAAAARKRVKLDVPTTESPAPAAPRPKKKSERASWIPTDEDGPTRTSSRRQTVANKESTLAKLKEKDRRRDDTLAMMKAAEARKAKDERKPLTQAERLAEATRTEKVNSKSLHRWEELEEQRAAERQAKLDAMKNRQIEGPFIRFYSGPAIWVDDKLKFTGKDVPKLEELEEKLNKDIPASASQPAQPEATGRTASDHTQPSSLNDPSHVSHRLSLTSVPESQPSSMQNSLPPPPQTSQAPVRDISAGSHGMPYPSTIMFAPPENTDSFLFGIEQYAQPNQHNTHSLALSQTENHETSPQYAHTQMSAPELPQNPFLEPHSSLNDPLLSQHEPGAQSLLSQFQRPPAPPAPRRRRLIQRALRNLLILSSFPNLDSAAPTRARTTASILKEKDRSALIQLSTTLFGWSHADAAAFVTAMLNAPKTKKEKEALQRPKKELCAITNNIARYRDPETGIAYRDARAFGVLRGVVGGGFVWSGELGCYVGGRAKPMLSADSAKSKGFLGMAPAAGVPKRFLEMKREMMQAPTQAAKENPAAVAGEKADVPPTTGDAGAQQPPQSTSDAMKVEEPVAPLGTIGRS